MSGVIAALKECQGKMGTGYLSAFPPKYFDRLEALRAVWAPYYTIHKVCLQILINQNSNIIMYKFIFILWRCYIDHGVLTDHDRPFGSIPFCWKLSNSANACLDG